MWRTQYHYIESERMFILKLEGQEMIATITEDLVKSLHAMGMNKIIWNVEMR